MSGPPCVPEDMFIDIGADFLQRMRPPRGPRRVLCVVVVAKSRGQVRMTQPLLNLRYVPYLHH